MEFKLISFFKVSSAFLLPLPLLWLMVTNEGTWMWYKVKRKKNGLTVKAFQTGGLAADLEKKEQDFFFYYSRTMQSLMNTHSQRGAVAQLNAE